MKEPPSPDLTNERRRRALELLHEFKEAPTREKAARAARLNEYLDALRKGTTASRHDLLECLQRDYYPDFRAQKRRSREG